MDGFRAMKLKRKELEEVNDDFSDFSLSSPATKIRRLDADFPPAMVEEKMTPPFVSPAGHLSFGIGPVRNSGLIIEELPNEPENEERALVLFKPMNTALNQFPLSHSILMDPELLSRINNKIWSSKPTVIESTQDESDQSLAVVPWAPSKLPTAPDADVSLMEADNMGVASMDIEEENFNINHELTNTYSNVSNPNPVEHLNQWPHQHCLIPQLPQNTSAPITWYQ